MKQFIAPQMLKVTGRPSPCECVNEPSRQVICAYCTQANLILWERAERPEENVENQLLRAVKKIGPRKTARLMAIDHRTVSYWIKREKIPSRYFERLRNGLGIAA